MTIYLVRHAKSRRARRLGRRRSAATALGRGHRAGACCSSTCSHDARFERVLSSPYVRCMETVVPIAALRGLAIEPVEALAEGAATRRGARARAKAHRRTGAVMCTHGDVMPMLLDHYASLGVDIGPAPAVAQGLHVGARDRRHGSKSCSARHTVDSPTGPSCGRFVVRAGNVASQLRSRRPVPLHDDPLLRSTREEPPMRCRDRPRGPRLHAEGPGRQRRHAVVVPRQAERRARVLSLHLHRRVPGRAVLAPRRPLGVRRREGAGARHLVRLPPRAEAVGRRSRASRSRC